MITYGATSDNKVVKFMTIFFSVGCMAIESIYKENWQSRYGTSTFWTMDGVSYFKYARTRNYPWINITLFELVANYNGLMGLTPLGRLNQLFSQH